jgi:hypothetical protein
VPHRRHRARPGPHPAHDPKRLGLRGENPTRLIHYVRQRAHVCYRREACLPRHSQPWKAPTRESPRVLVRTRPARVPALALERPIVLEGPRTEPIPRSHRARGESFRLVARLSALRARECGHQLAAMLRPGPKRTERENKARPVSAGRFANQLGGFAILLNWSKAANAREEIRDHLPFCRGHWRVVQLLACGLCGIGQPGCNCAGLRERASSEPKLSTLNKS